MAIRGGIAALGALGCAALLGACAADGASQAAGEAAPRSKAAEGRAVAQAQCAECHAIGTEGRSPRPDAPPLRTVLANYNTATLEVDLMEGMRVGHAEMPRFTFDPQTVDLLITYLESIQE